MSDDEFVDTKRELMSGSRSVDGPHGLVCDGGPGVNDGGASSLEAIFRSLTVQRRRYVLYELKENEVTDLETLTTTVTKMIRNAPVDDVSPEHVDHTKAQLVHADIPLLAEAGFVEYDPRSQTIRYADPPPLLETVLRLCVEFDRPSEQ